MEWESLFADRIRKRGYNYFLDGKVSDLISENDELQTEVCGTEVYEVRIIRNGEDVQEMYCSCPYAADGNPCKHMAAVLYKTEAQKGEVSYLEFRDSNIGHALDRATPEQMKNFLKGVFRHDAELLHSFQSMLGREYAAPIYRYYTNKLDDILIRYFGKDEHLRKERSWQFQQAVKDFLERIVQRMIDQKSYNNAYFVTEHIIFFVGTHTIEDETVLESLVNVCCEKLEKIFTDCTVETKEELLDYYFYLLDMAEEELGKAGERIKALYGAFFEDYLY